MSEVSVTYKGEEIASLNDSNTAVLKTSGFYCEDDIEVVYERPKSGARNWIRPDWLPNMDWLDWNQEFYCYVYDKTYAEYYPLITITPFNTSSSGKMQIQIGHIDNDQFISEASFVASHNVAFTQQLNDYGGDNRFVIVYITPNSGHISYIIFNYQNNSNASSSSNYSYTLQGVVERFTHLPYSVSCGNNSSFRNACINIIHEKWVDLGISATSMNMAYAFGQEKKLECAELINCSDKATTVNSLFANNYALQKLVITNPIVGPKCTTVYNMFASCYVLKEIPTFEDWNLSNVTTLYGFLNGCKSLAHCDMSKWPINNNKITSMYYAFAYFNACEDNLDLSWIKADEGKLTGTALCGTFYSNYGLKEIDISKWNLQNISTLSYFCGYSSSLKEVVFPTDENYLPLLNKWTEQTAYNTNAGFYNAFYACFSLEKLDLSAFNYLSSKLKSYYYLCNTNYSLIEFKMYNSDSPLANGNTNNGITNCTSLCEYYPPSIIAAGNWNISTNGALSYNSLMRIINSLPNVTTSCTLTLGSVNKNKLTADEQALITKKGWKIA